MNSTNTKHKISAKTFRTNDWVLSKYLFNLSIIFAFHITLQESISCLLLISLLYLCYMIPMGALGYFTNDVFDIKSDKLAGKTNHSSNLQPKYRKLILAGLLISSLSPVFLFKQYQIHYLLLSIMQIFCFILYSIHPFRFKTKYTGVICDSLFSFIFPALIAILFVADTSGIPKFNLLFLISIIWLFAIGLRSIIDHQINDFIADKKSNQQTFCQRIGRNNSITIQTVFFIIEIIAFMYIVYNMTSSIQYGLLISTGIFIIIEIFIHKSVNLKHFFKRENFASLNLFYNVYLLIGLCFSFVIEENYKFLFLIIALIFYRASNWIISRFSIISKFFYYKYNGLIKRIKNDV